jgi:hypothetical protein
MSAALRWPRLRYQRRFIQIHCEAMYLDLVWKWDRNNEGMDDVLVVDGNCGLARASNDLLRLDRVGRLRGEPVQKPAISERLGGAAERLPESECALPTPLNASRPWPAYRVPGGGTIQKPA